MDGPFAAGNVATLFDTWQAQWAPVVAEAHETDPEHISPDRWNGSIDALKLTTYRRRAAVEDIIEMP